MSVNPTWGAPPIHGELLKLGFELSERSVSRWIWQAPRDPDSVKRWLTFLRNHREAIAAMDFFTIPTLTFGVLSYGQKTRRARCPTHEPHVKRRLMINQAR
jgi:hypothetical protein